MTADPVVLSGSSLATFLRCPTQWELAYVRKIKRAPSLKMALGLSAHAAVEKDLKHKVRTWEDLPREEVIEAFVDDFAESSYGSPEKPEKKETHGTMLDSGVLAVGVWHDQVAPDHYPILVEQNGQFNINGVAYDWTADSVDTEEAITDWKFVGRKPDRGAEYALNMIGYAVGLREQRGIVESGVRLQYLVRTKIPYPHLLEGPTVPNVDIQIFASMVTGAHDQIMAGYFPPHGLKSGACSWCAYSDGTCPYYRRKT